MAAFEFLRASGLAPRADVRAEISVDIASYLSGALTPVTLLRATLGGCRLQSDVALVPGSIQQLRIATSGGRIIPLIVRIGSCRPPMFGPRTSWVVECVFAHADASAVKNQIAAVLEDVLPDRRVA